MANTLGSLATGLIVQEALSLAFTKRPILNRISLNCRDLDGRVEGLSKGQSVTTRIKTVATVGNFGDAATGRNDTDVSVTLSDFKQIYHSFTAAEIVATDRDLVRESAEPIAIGLANHFVDAIAALWVAASYTNSTTLGAGWDYTHLTGVRNTLNGRGVPDAKRFYVGNSNVYQSLLNDPLIVAELNNAANSQAIRTGILPDVAGFGLMEYPGLPTTGNMVAFAGVPETVLLVVRPPRDPEQVSSAKFPGNSALIQEPRTGLTVRVDEWIDTNLTANVRLSWLQGLDEGNTAFGQIIKSS